MAESYYVELTYPMTREEAREAFLEGLDGDEEVLDGEFYLVDGDAGGTMVCLNVDATCQGGALDLAEQIVNVYLHDLSPASARVVRTGGWLDYLLETAHT